MEQRHAMFNEKLSTCPRCGARMERGFSVRTHGLSWIPPEKMKRFAFVDQDLNAAGVKQYLPLAKAAYDLSYHCPHCKLYIVDYSTSVSSAEAKALAETL